jgi:hypothetical protein
VLACVLACVPLGSTYAYGILDTFYRPDLEVEEAVEVSSCFVFSFLHQSPDREGAQRGGSAGEARRRACVFSHACMCGMFFDFSCSVARVVGQASNLSCNTSRCVQRRHNQRYVTPVFVVHFHVPPPSRLSALPFCIGTLLLSLSRMSSEPTLVPPSFL